MAQNRTQDMYKPERGSAIQGVRVCVCERQTDRQRQREEERASVLLPDCMSIYALGPPLHLCLHLVLPEGSPDLLSASQCLDSSLSSQAAARTPFLQPAPKGKSLSPLPCSEPCGLSLYSYPCCHLLYTYTFLCSGSLF